MDDKELIDLFYTVIEQERAKIVDIAEILGVQPESISRWRKTDRLSRNSRGAIAAWLASKGVSISEPQMACYFKNCPAREPIEYLTSYLLDEWRSLTGAERAEVVALIEQIKERKKQSHPANHPAAKLA